MTKKVCALLLAFLLTISQLAFAEEASTSSEKIDIQLQIGNELVTINGQELTVEKPYLANGVTLVPLRVVTAAFGAILDWDGATQTVKLTYGEKTLSLTIDSMSAEVDGETMPLPAAPELKNNTTMVPIRFISQNFDADVSYDPDTLKIGITGTKKAAAGADENGLDSDAGKTQIGNSYYNWSIKYPPGLVKETQSFKESIVVFKDAKDDFVLFVGVEVDQDENMTKDGLLKYLSGMVEESILDKSYVDAGTQSYARVISKDGKGINEYRAYRVDDRIYHLRLSTSEEKYKNAEKLKNFKELLDSFKTSFDPNDNTLKNLSTVKDGKRKYTDDDSGVTLQIPAEWEKVVTPEWLVFVNPDETGSLSIRMTSAQAGDTADAWVKRESKYLEQEFVSDYIKFDSVKDMKLGDTDAKLMKYSLSLGDKWTTVYGAYVVKGKYKYEFSIRFSKGKDERELAESLLTGISFSDNPSSALGTIEDDGDFIDRTKTSVMTNKKKKFSISIPDYWKNSNDDEEYDLKYSANAGAVMISVIDNATFDQFVKKVDSLMNQRKDQVEDFQMLQSSPETFNGLQAKRYVYSGTINNVPYVSTSVVTVKNDFVYVIDVFELKATSTTDNKKMFADIVSSFKALD